MPRIAIKDYNTSFFHVMVQGIRKENIFKSEEDKNTYLRLMCKYLKKYDVKIIAYCIMSNHAHILFYVEKVEELSKYMKCINTTYALYYNKKYKTVGYVFRNRYKAEPIYNEKYLVNCIHYIHDNPIKAKICINREEYKYSSYYEYALDKGHIIKESNQKFKEINQMFQDRIYEQREIDYTYIDYVEDKELKNKKQVIEDYIKIKMISIGDIKKDKKFLGELSKKLKEECGMTQQEIADEFEVSRMKIARLINK